VSVACRQTSGEGIVCRLFGLHTGAAVTATFWLLDAPDSLSEQSHRQPDGAGIGVFGTGGEPIVYKRPIAAWQDRRFAAEARALTSATFVAHVRYASTGARTVANTHPFTQDGRIFAHNGVFTELDAMDRQLAELGVSQLVGGQTDSERMFALITAYARSDNGDAESGLVRALNWIAENLPVYSLNLVLAGPEQMWALRYPDTHELYVLERGAGGRHRDGAPLDATSPRIRARSEELSRRGSIVIATEPMDGDPGWRLLHPGELIRVERDLSVQSSFPVRDIPRRRLRITDLDPVTAASQHPVDPPPDSSRH
jgi:predicted glutamine amidotransferase